MNFFLFFHLANRNADMMVGAGATMLNHVSIIHILEMTDPQSRRNLERDSWNVPWGPCICNSILVKPLQFGIYLSWPKQIQPTQMYNRVWGLRQTWQSSVKTKAPRWGTGLMPAFSGGSTNTEALLCPQPRVSKRQRSFHFFCILCQVLRAPHTMTGMPGHLTAWGGGWIEDLGHCVTKE